MLSGSSSWFPGEYQRGRYELEYGGEELYGERMDGGHGGEGEGNGHRGREVGRDGRGGGRARRGVVEGRRITGLRGQKRARKGRREGEERAKTISGCGSSREGAEDRPWAGGGGEDEESEESRMGGRTITVLPVPPHSPEYPSPTPSLAVQLRFNLRRRALSLSRAQVGGAGRNAAGRRSRLKVAGTVGGGISRMRGSSIYAPALSPSHRDPPSSLDLRSDHLALIRDVFQHPATDRTPLVLDKNTIIMHYNHCTIQYDYNTVSASYLMIFSLTLRDLGPLQDLLVLAQSVAVYRLRDSNQGQHSISSESSDSPNGLNDAAISPASSHLYGNPLLFLIAHWQARPSEIEVYFSDVHPCEENGALKWWKEHAAQFPVLALIARDILAIPGVSINIAVERLFLSCRHTLRDARSSLSASSASMTVITKGWLKRGLGDNIDY
ncbi:hypothetical protein NUW54_g10886 [Trametes sanguinea]|uniref:Uncharacterized protein n=1 Tax=Trametes sanguinea TaxID=158606 RepID=A0ACC1NQZ0_9APHY|nr:hypothetical protein NUW54_g10886 [Trametes sanguinea]